MGDVLAFPGQPAEAEAPTPPRPPIPTAEQVMEFDYETRRVVDSWGSIDGEEFWSYIEDIKNMIAEWSRG